MHRFSLILLFIFLTGCGSNLVFEQRDSAPSRQVDVSHIPNATPRAEPKSRYSNKPSYVVRGKRYYVMDSADGYVERGLASWYGNKFHGRPTSSMEPYDMYKMTAAHKSLPLPSYVQVTNLDNHRSIIVRVNDRGPFYEGRIIDLSYVAAIKLGIIKAGTGRVEVRALRPGDVIKPSRAHPTHTPKPKHVAHHGKIYLQIGAFANEANAQQMKARLLRSSINNVIIQSVLNTQQQRLYRVKIGPIANNTLVNQMTQRLRALAIHNPYVLIE